VTNADADLRDGDDMLGEVIGGIAALAAAAIAAWATLRARRQKDGVIGLVDVSVTEAEAVLAEPGADAHVLSAIVPKRPVLDIAVRNDGDRTEFVRRMHLELKGLLSIPAIDPPVVLPFPRAITGPLPAKERRLEPSGSYAVNFPLLVEALLERMPRHAAPPFGERLGIAVVAALGDLAAPR
jgi:hypothetical protein